MKASPAFTARDFPRGAYWITDPCYLYPDGEWGKFCEELNGDGVYEHSGHSFFVWATAYGDGMYPIIGPKCGTAGVDSGMLAVIPSDLVRLWDGEDYAKDLEKRALACSIRLARKFTINEEEGNIFFDKYCVDTSGFTCEDEDDEDSDGEDEIAP
jgi:hypothetical protein